MQFASALFANMLDESIGWIQSNMDPEDVFSDEQLVSWAESNGYKKVNPMTKRKAKDEHSIMFDDRRRQIINQQAERANLSDKERDILFSWAHSAIICHAVFENIMNGSMRVVRIEGDEPLFEMTPEGFKNIEKLKKRADEDSHD